MNEEKMTEKKENVELKGEKRRDGKEGNVNIGRITQVIGPVIDVEFNPEMIPEIYTALKIDEKVDGQHIELTAEVQQHLGRNNTLAATRSKLLRYPPRTVSSGG
jgi:hypothetical protein